MKWFARCYANVSFHPNQVSITTLRLFFDPRMKYLLLVTMYFSDLLQNLLLSESKTIHFLVNIVLKIGNCSLDIDPYTDSTIILVEMNHPRGWERGLKTGS